MNNGHPSVRARLAILCGAMLMGSMGLVGCREAPDDGTTTVTGAITGTLSITGTIVDAGGNPRSGVIVRLAGSSQATATTGATGTYAFNGIGPAGYSVQPSLAGCTFAPTVVNVNLTASTVVNFDGSGPACGGAPQNSGATTGSLTISGRVTNAAGNPVSGVKVNLNGTTQGVRTTTASGAYSFSVNPGSYSVQPSGPCAFTPTVVNLNNLNASRTQNFVAGPGCVATPGTGGGSGGTPGTGGSAGTGGSGSGGAAGGSGGASGGSGGAAGATSGTGGIGIG
jgi:hypothetical protein